MSCSQCLIRCLPVLAIYIFIFWSYYVYVVIVCFYLITDNLKQILYLTFYHILFLMLVWCHLVAMCTTHRRVPSRYRLGVLLATIRDRDQLIRSIEKLCRRKKLVLFTRNDDGSIRYCKKCNHVKPDRTHHCSNCEVCILKMDHHCPWINNCVGYTNQKQFILALFYGCCYCLFFLGTLAEYLIRFIFWGNIDKSCGYQIIGVTILGITIGVLVTALLCYHTNLLIANKTTLEDLKEPNFIHPTYTFNLGCKDNFTEVFGGNCCLWPLPVRTAKSNGCDFPVEYSD